MSQPTAVPATSQTQGHYGWRSFFQTRRRTAGFAALLLTCGLMAVWYRSLTTYDSVVLNLSTTRCIIFSIGGRVRLGLSDPLNDDPWCTWKRGDRCVFDSPLPNVGESHAPEQGRWKWGRFRYQVGSFDEGLLQVRFRIIEFPDWALVVPLGLIGLVLLRRRRTSDSAVDSPSERLSDNHLASRRALIFLALLLVSAVVIYDQSRNEFVLTNLTGRAITVSNISVSSKGVPGGGFQPPGWNSLERSQPLENTVARNLEIRPFLTIHLTFTSHARAQVYVEYADTWLHGLDYHAWGNRIYLRFDELNFQSSSERTTLSRWCDRL